MEKQLGKFNENLYGEVTWIDKTAPNAFTAEISVTTNSLTVSGSTTDNSGR